MIVKLPVLLLLIFMVCSISGLFSPKVSNLDMSEKTCFSGLSLVTKETFEFDPLYYLGYINGRNPILQLNCENTPLILSITEGQKDSFTIEINKDNVTITTSSYSGYVYALQTINQLGKDGSLPQGSLKDAPLVQYRGVMIDSVRHFLSVKSIKRTIQAMAIVRLNYLHWHLTDDQAFTLTLKNHPQMVEGSYDKNTRYSLEEVQDIIAFATQHAVDIIPQIDTPGHVRSWSQNKKHQGITIQCPGGQGYNNQLDLSIDEVWTLGKEVIQQLGDIFKNSPYIHLGGDQVFGRCWDQRPEIRAWMYRHNISTYGQLQMLWRQSLVSALPGRNIIFWRNDDSEVLIKDNQVMHYWGSQKDAATVTAIGKSKIILSPSDYLYLNSGQGFVTSKSFGHYSTWEEIYVGFMIFPDRVDRQRILGASVALFGEVSNEDTLDNNLWPRSIVFAEMTWTEQKVEIPKLVEGVVKLSKELQAIGVQVSAIVPEYCQNKPYDCRYSKLMSERQI